MAKIERYCTPGVFDPPTYSQGVKVTGALVAVAALAHPDWLIEVEAIAVV